MSENAGGGEEGGREEFESFRRRGGVVVASSGVRDGDLWRFRRLGVPAGGDED